MAETLDAPALSTLHPGGTAYIVLALDRVWTRQRLVIQDRVSQPTSRRVEQEKGHLRHHQSWKVWLFLRGLDSLTCLLVSASCAVS